ncbi:MAG: anaerobic sulfatase maturase [Firmicutes bacterium]|nr:anaerobic sulfatase maturase [Bacillota bacterium]
MPGETFKAAQPFAVMAKPVGSRCNLQCSYCYYHKVSDAEKNMGRLRMTEELLEIFIRQYLEASPGPEVSFVWHGGEPTLAGLDFYRLAVNIQDRYLPDGWRCRNNLQTNGLLLDDEWCSFLAAANFDVGLSIDGTEWLHNRYRQDAAGKGAYRGAVSAVRRLQAHGIQPDLLCTVTDAAAQEPLETYHGLRGLDTGWIQFIPIVRRDSDGRVTPDSVTGAGYGDFLCAVFDEWAFHDLGRLDVQLFAETARVWGGGGAGLCWMAPTCGRVLIVELDGGVYSCDHFVTQDYRIGDLYSAHLGALVDAAVQRRFGEHKRDGLPGRCRSCTWLEVCNGGCPKDRFVLSAEQEPNLNYLCPGLEKFFSHAQPVMKEIIRSAKLGQSPGAIMSALRGQALLNWKGISRNDPCPCGSGRKAKHCCWSKRP